MHFSSGRTISYVYILWMHMFWHWQIFAWKILNLAISQGGHSGRMGRIDASQQEGHGFVSQPRVCTSSWVSSSALPWSNEMLNIESWLLISCKAVFSDQVSDDVCWTPLPLCPQPLLPNGTCLGMITSPWTHTNPSLSAAIPLPDHPAWSVLSSSCLLVPADSLGSARPWDTSHLCNSPWGRCKGSSPLWFCGLRKKELVVLWPSSRIGFTEQRTWRLHMVLSYSPCEL